MFPLIWKKVKKTAVGVSLNGFPRLSWLSCNSHITWFHARLWTACMKTQSLDLWSSRTVLCGVTNRVLGFGCFVCNNGFGRSFEKKRKKRSQKQRHFMTVFIIWVCFTSGFYFQHRPIFMLRHDCAPVHKSKTIKTWLGTFSAVQLDWQVEPTHFNHTENPWKGEWEPGSPIQHHSLIS